MEALLYTDQQMYSRGSSREITHAPVVNIYNEDTTSRPALLNPADAISQPSPQVPYTRPEVRFAVEDAATFNTDCALKRAIDVVMALLLLICLSPALAVCCTLVLLSSRGSLFYKQLRVGKDGKVFSMWKLRTMYENSDHVLERHLKRHPELQELWQETIKLKNDPRVTRIGKILRRFSLDELPQLWNVSVGDMSLVGPRPISVCQLGRYGAGLQHYRCMRPGLTGLWQTSGRSTTSFETRISLDKQYVQNWSLLLDIHIWRRTFNAVLSGRGAY